MITVCHDMKFVSDFMMLPEVAHYAVEYGANPSDKDFECNGRNGWLQYMKDGEAVGLIEFHLETGTMAMFHPYILRKFKEDYDQMFQEFFQWFLKDVPEQIVKLNVLVAVIYKGGIRAAEKAGMTHEGIDRLSCLSKDGPCDRMLLGVTREELK